jgi:hypothetical protein
MVVGPSGQLTSKLCPYESLSVKAHVILMWASRSLLPSQRTARGHRQLNQSRRCGSRARTTPTPVTKETVISALATSAGARSSKPGDDHQNEGTEDKSVDDAVRCAR